MKMSDNKRFLRSFSGKGYYIALILCAAAIGISGYLYVRNENQVQEVSLQETIPGLILEPSAETEPKAVSAPELPPATAAAVPQPAPKEKALKTQAPLEGAEAAAFSIEALSYNETTRDWRTHDGVDLAAEEGTPVRASAEGKVYTTYDDDTLGATVVIRHQGGYTTRYASLREDLKVKAGDSVALGQTIGYVGTTALTESVLGPHVHFSVSCQNVPMDPADFLNLQ